MRQSKTVNGVTTEHIYSGMNVVQEKEGSNLKATYHRMGNQVIYSEVNGNRNFYIYNAQGNVSKLLNSEYETVADYAFDAFGVQKMVNGEVYNPFRHNGEYYDEELGYTYLRNRYYDNVTGRFITEDPVKDGLNWYSYCGGNPIAFVDSWGLWEEGDEKLSQGAQTYTKYYGEQWQMANKNYLLATTDAERIEAQKEKEYWHALAEDIRQQDAKGKVQGVTLDAPIYNQMDTYPNDYRNNLCWATCQAMVVSFYLGDTIDRTQSIASYTRAFIECFDGTPVLYNEACYWVSSDQLYLELSQSQSQTLGILTVEEIKNTIDNQNPFGVLYRDEYSGHWVLGIGYAIAEGHDPLVISNDPWGGIQNIQTYDDFKTYNDGRVWKWTAK